MTEPTLKRWKKREPAAETVAKPAVGEVTLAADLPKNELVEAVLADPSKALTVKERRDEFFEAVKAQTSALVPDTSTAKGRQAIKAAAFAVTKMKTGIDNHGKKLKEEAQATVTKVDAARKDIRDRLDALAEEVRKPLTLWEEAEADRIKICDDVIQRLRDAAVVRLDETSEDVAARAERVKGAAITADQFRDKYDTAIEVRDGTLATLEAAHARIVLQEASNAELQRLKDAEAQRLADEAEAQRIEDERQAAVAAEEARVAAERDREANAAEAARLHTEALAAEEAAALQKQHAAELAAANQRAADLEAAAQAERARIAEEDRVAAARAKDREHRGKVMREAKEAIMRHGVDEEVAKAIVLAIASDAVPHTRIEF